MNRITEKKSFLIFKWSVRILVFFILCGMAAVILFQVNGLPDYLTTRIISAIKSPAFAFDIGQMRFIPGGIRAFDVKVYRKQVITRPAATARRVDIKLSFSAILRGTPPLRTIHAFNADLHPLFTRGPALPHSPQNKHPQPANFTVIISDSRMDGVTIKHLSAEITVKGPHWTFNNVQAQLRRAAFRAVLNGTGRYENTNKLLAARVKTTLDPPLVLPWCRTYKWTAIDKLIRKCTFTQHHSVRANAIFDLICVSGGAAHVTARINGRALTYNHVPLSSADADLRIINEHRKRITLLSPIHLVRPEGESRFNLKINSLANRIDFNGTGQIDPHAATRMIGILTNGVMDNFYFEPPTSVSAGGSAIINRRDGVTADITMSGPAINFLKLRMTNYACRINVRGLTCRVRDFTAGMCGGSFTGNTLLHIPPNNSTTGTYSAHCTLQNADFEKTLQMFFKQNTRKYSGRLSGNLELAGPMTTNILQTITGTGNFSLKRGRVFMLPVFGGLTKIMTSILPGLNFVISQNTAQSAFKIANARLHTRKLEIKGDVISIEAHGDYLMNGNIDFVARVTLLKSQTFISKLLNPVFYPVSKLFEFRVYGPAVEPRWYPVNFSGDMLRKIGLKKKKEKKYSPE